MKHLTTAVALAALLVLANTAQANPGPAPSGTVIAEYDWLTGEIVVSVADVNNWFIQSTSFGLTGDAPVGLPGSVGGLLSDGDGLIGETSLATYSYTDTNLGNVAAPSLPFGDLSISSNAGLGQPTVTGPVNYLNFPTNIPPTALINGPFSVDVLLDPLNLLLDASSSFDDGKQSPLTYMWDLDNNGVFELNTGTNPTFEITDVTSTFSGLGIFPVSVEVFDGEFSDIVSTTVDLFTTPPPVNQPPTAQINGPFLVDLFVDPLDITLDASGSTDDSLLSPLTHMWDLDGDGIFEVDTGTTDFLDIPDVEAAFGGVGTYPVSLKVYDGEFFDTTSTAVEIFSTDPLINLPPTARLNGPFLVDIDTGLLEITLDGGLSTDDGDLGPLTYMWDLDSDGIFEISTGMTDFLDIADVTDTFGGVGNYPIALQVFDGEFSDDVTTTLRLVDATVVPPGTATVSYNPATGEIVVSINGVNNWFIQSASGGLTGEEPNFDPIVFGSFLSNDDFLIGETGFSIATGSNVSLGNVAALNLPFGDLTISWNAGLGSATQTNGVSYLGAIPEPTTLTLVAFALCGVLSQRRRTDTFRTL